LFHQDRYTRHEVAATREVGPSGRTKACQAPKRHILNQINNIRVAHEFPSTRYNLNRMQKVPAKTGTFHIKAPNSFRKTNLPVTHLE
jgi:hypothetical protein